MNSFVTNLINGNTPSKIDNPKTQCKYQKELLDLKNDLKMTSEIDLLSFPDEIRNLDHI